MRRRGFTTTEVLVVVAILVVLSALAVPAFQAVRRKGQVQAGRALLDELRLAVAAYASDHGDPPPSGPRGRRRDAPGEPNQGIEALVLALQAPGPKGTYFTFDPARLGDVDGDGRQEAVDPWGTPLAYLHNRAYDAGATVSLPLGGEDHVSAARDEAGQLRGLTSYQLWSAGPDGQAGTDDDLRAWGD